MDCLAVRDRLAEYAVSGLPAAEDGALERHLEWCAGCRKEAAELEEAAAVVGLSLSEAEPPPELEDRVVAGVSSAARRPLPTRRRMRGLIAATVAAALLGIAGLGWGVAMFARVQNADQRARATKEDARHDLQRLRTLLTQLSLREGGGEVTRFTRLFPQKGGAAGGAGVVLVSPRSQDWVLVVAGGLDPKAAPYRVWVKAPSGPRVLVRTIRGVRTSDGGAQVLRSFQRDLTSVRKIVVTDRLGNVDLSGHIKQGSRSRPA
jgi:hypothetical protein